MNWNNKILATIFFALFGIWLLTNIINKPSTRSFKSTLLAIDTSLVDKVILYPKGIDSSLLELKKEGNNWIVTQDKLRAMADKDKVNNLLGQFVRIPTKQLISKKEDNQSNYEVDNQNGKILEIYSKNALLEKVIFGRFNFNQTTRTSTSYARLADENEIYALDGMIGLSLAKDFNAFRANDLLTINPVDIKGLMLNNEIVSLNDQGLWIYNNMPLDSLKIVNYLNGLSTVSSYNFVNDFSIEQIPQKILRITADNQTAPLELSCYTSGSSFVIKSSDNEAYFSSDSTGVYDKIFGQLEEILVAVSK